MAAEENTGSFSRSRSKAVPEDAEARTEFRYVTITRERTVPHLLKVGTSAVICFRTKPDTP